MYCGFYHHLRCFYFRPGSVVSQSFAIGLLVHGVELWEAHGKETGTRSVGKKCGERWPRCCHWWTRMSRSSPRYRMFRAAPVHCIHVWRMSRSCRFPETGKYIVECRDQARESSVMFRFVFRRGSDEKCMSPFGRSAGDCSC